MNTLVNPTPRMKLCRQPVSNLLVLLKDTELMISWIPTQYSGCFRQPTQTESCKLQSHQGTTNIFNEQHTFRIKVNHHHNYLQKQDTAFVLRFAQHLHFLKFTYSRTFRWLFCSEWRWPIETTTCSFPHKREIFAGHVRKKQRSDAWVCSQLMSVHIWRLWVGS